jgi:hypothetical protein
MSEKETYKAQRSIYIEAREWFDKANGNSYYSARVWVDGKHAFTTGLTYGYGDQYEYDVTQELELCGWLPESLQGRNIHWARDLGLDIYCVIYSTPKRNLWKEDRSEAVA